MEKVLGYLERLKLIAQNKKESFRVKAFVNAIQILKKFPTELISVVQLDKIPGLGKGILERIEIILKTGKLPEVDDDPILEQLEILGLFQTVPGIGPVKAKEFYDKGYRTLEEISGYDKLTSHQKIGLKYHDDLELSIPREEIDDIFDLICDIVGRYNDTFKTDITMVVAGSYRRGKKISGDIDIVVASRDPDVLASNHLKTIIEYLKDEKIITTIISEGKTKIMGICQLNEESKFRRIDFEIVDNINHFWACLLYFTGSKELNLKMRSQALKCGWTLNQNGLYDKDKRFNLSSEEDYFAKLGLEYLEPEDR
jgi:DNA polymerase/3'-5' exonuclease PolX